MHEKEEKAILHGEFIPATPPVSPREEVRNQRRERVVGEMRVRVQQDQIREQEIEGKLHANTKDPIRDNQQSS